MISYDLANELKQNGFPQRGWGFRACDHNKDALKLVQRCECQMVDLVSVPGQGELLHEITDFYQLENNTFNWEGIDYDWRAITHGGIYAFGHTADEALANLYIKIKSK